MAKRAERRRAPAPPDEERLYGLHACRAVFARRRDDIRRVYVDEARIDDVRDLLKWCASAGVAYKVVGPADLEKVTKSTHHEGIALLARRPRPATLEDLVSALERDVAPARVLLLENVRDPHNVGAIVRTAAHFGARAVLLAGDTARRSPALLRTAEGGAESVALVEVARPLPALRRLKKAGLEAAATSSHVERSLFQGALPERLVLLLGAEREGLSRPLLDEADLQIAIPGTGAVESLNVASACAVVLAEHWRQSSVRERPLKPRPARARRRP